METASLEKVAQKLRFEAVRMIYEGKDGHPGPALSIADIVAVLFFREMNLDPKRPDWEDRDRFVLSKGHACPVYYAALNERGYFQPKVEHFQLRQLGSIFQGHPSMHSTPGVDMTSGSLGNGIAVSAGMAAAGRAQGRGFYVYCICGDGELQEGVCWEGVNVAAGGRVSFKGRVLVKEALNVSHDLQAIHSAVQIAKSVPGAPHCIVCDCVKGKGVSFMENNNAWHKGVPTDEEYAIACKELGGDQQ